MSKRIATFQISDRNPVDPNDDDGEPEINYDSEGESNEQEIRQRKISKPKSRGTIGNKPAASLGNLFAGLPTNPFGQPSSLSSAGGNSADLDLKMRGLNKCFVESANKLIERSPAADFTKLFEQYSKHLASFSTVKPASKEPIAQQAFSMKPAPSNPVSVPSLPIVSESFGAKNDSSFKAPVGESVKSVAFNFKPAEAESKPKTFEFKPVMAETSKPFKVEMTTSVMPVDTEMTKPAAFDFKPIVHESKTVETNKPVNAFDFKPVETLKPVEMVKPSVFDFKSVETSKNVETTTTSTFDFKPVEMAKPTGFNFKPLETLQPLETSKPSTFEFKPVTSETKSVDTRTSIEQSSVSEIKVPSSSEAVPMFKPFSFGANTESMAPPSFNFGVKPASFSFGSSTVTEPSSIKKQDEPETEKSTSFGSFSFGAAQPAPTAASESPKFSFGSSFSFGNGGGGGLAPLPAFNFGGSTSKTTAGSSGTGFSFTVPPSASDPQSGGEDADEIPAEEAESFTLTRTNSEHLKTGAGEENETCQHEERCKVFMMDSTGTSGWIDLGIGIFKINRYNNEPGKARILCRTEGSGKVILNSLVSVPGMDVSSTEGKKEVALLTIGSEGKPTKYLIRVKTLDQAAALKSAILAEIDYIKSSKQAVN